MIKVILLSFFTTLLITTGQVLWKLGLQKIGGFYLYDRTLLENILRIMTNGWIISGFIVYAIATGFFMWLLSKFDISLVIPITSVAFIYSLIAGYYIFGEQITMIRIIGVALIVLGVVMVVRN